jgi:hypothetical protein
MFPETKISPKGIAWGLASVVAITFFVARSSSDWVWNDSSQLAQYFFDDPDHILLRQPSWLVAAIHESFGALSRDGYRPLASLSGRLAIGLFGTGPLPVPLLIAAVSALYGATAACVFKVAQRFLGSEIWAAYATLLFVSSPAIVPASWVIGVGTQLLIPFLICLGLILYWQFEEAQTSWLRVTSVTGLFVILFLGPWYREFLGLTSILVIFLELRRAGRVTLLLSGAAIFLLHAIYPTAIVKAVFVRDLPLVSIFQIGSLHAAMGLPRYDFTWFDKVKGLADSLKIEVSGYFLMLFPPSLVVLCLSGFLLSPFRRRTTPRAEGLAPQSRVLEYLKANRDTVSLAFFLVFVTMSGAIWLVVEPDRSPWLLVAGWAVFGLIAFGSMIDPLLGIWLFLSLAPFYRVFTETVHLSYASLPAAIIVTCGLQRLFILCRERWPDARVLQGATSTCLAILLVDQLMNVYAAWHSIDEMNKGMKIVAATLEQQVPKGAIVVSNALHAMDIELFSGGHFRTVYTISEGVPLIRRADFSDMLLHLINANPGHVYLLDIDQPFLGEKMIHHSHKYVRDHSVDSVLIAEIHKTQIFYPYLDPLKLLVDRPFIPFVGPPDLVNDFYDGPDLAGAPFLNEVYARYTLYHVTGTAVDSWHPEGHLRMTQEGYFGYNILDWNERYFAVPQSAGAIDEMGFLNRVYPGLLVADSLDAIRTKIDTEEKKGIAAGTNCFNLSMVEEGYRGYNVLTCSHRLYAVPQSAGAVDSVGLAEKRYPGLVFADDIAAVHAAIDRLREKQAVDSSSAATSLLMVQQGYRGYNILAANHRFFGVPESAGPVDEAGLKRNQYAGVLVADDIDTVRLRIDAETSRKGVSNETEPGLVVVEQGYHGYNILTLGQHYFAIPQRLGAVDEAGLRDKRYPEVISGEDLESVRDKIDAVSTKVDQQSDTHSSSRSR